MLQRLFILLCSFLLLPLVPQLSRAAESLKDQHIQIDWLAPQSFSANGETLIGIRFRPDPHWHVYWKNPGDSGAAPKFQITAQNAEVGSTLWPYPKRLPVAHLTNLGYEGETAYLFKIKTTSASPMQLEVGLEWLVCQEECVPGFGKLTLLRPVVGTQSEFNRATKTQLEFFESKLPRSGANSPYHLELSEMATGAVKVTITSSTTLPENLDLFPADPEYILPAAPQIMEKDSSFEVIFQKSAVAKKPSQFEFLLLADGKAFEFQGVKESTPRFVAETPDFVMLLILFVSALVGGIILNLMPCVFPVISIKAVSLLKNPDRAERKRDGFLYTAGVLTTFVALGVGFLILRQLGSAVGWGFQLQSPLVVYSLIVLFWLMALNFLGVFEIGTAIMNSTGKLNWHSSFGAGVLSVFIAAPCTGPFMGTALGATATLPSVFAVLVFFFLGLGLALPYLALTLSDMLARKIPKPGAWMETLKEFLAFPLFATVLWLLWVLGQQAGTQGWVHSGLALLGISFALWLGKRKRTFWKPLAWIFAVLLLTYAGHRVQTAEADTSATSAQGEWVAYSDEKLSEALQSGQSVFVDFTAAWCITCQVNKKVVLETSAAEEIFKKSNILRLRADWTKQDPKVTAALTRLGRNSVPVYAFYANKNADPVLLPQILTIDMIENLIPSKEEK